MKPGTLLGLYRERVFSPGKIDDDAAILDATLDELSGMGYEVARLHAETLDRTTPGTETVLTMAQSPRVLGILAEWENRGARIINSVRSVRNCYRRPLVSLLRGSGVRMPRSRMVSLEEARETIDLQPSERLWFKRGDVHAIQEGDVAPVSSREELAQALDHFQSKNIRDILVQEHVEGPVVKFYGVGYGRYFKAYLALTGEDITQDASSLSAAAGLAAEAVGLAVYGGDAVLTNGDGASLIDLNDWPSFSRCCGSAARSIAGYVSREIKLRSSGHLRS